MRSFILYPNPKRSWWLMRYNALVTKIKSGKLKFFEISRRAYEFKHQHVDKDKLKVKNIVILSTLFAK